MGHVSRLVLTSRPALDSRRSPIPGDPKERRSTNADTAGNDPRGPFHKDHDRVFFSDEFARLEGVTQVATANLPSLKNRLTHSYRVEQIARSIAVKFPSEVEEDVVMAAALAHDLGHAPFGHTGEVALHEILVCEHHRNARTNLAERAKTEDGNRVTFCDDCILPDGFEGNAQTFRILVRLAVKRSNETGGRTFGLDLTRRTLEACSKYPWTRGGNQKWSKWGAYDTDASDLTWVMDVQDSPAARLEAKVMDFADDIAYAVHDLEDFYRAGVIPLSELRFGERMFARVIDYIHGENDKIGSSPLADLVGQYQQYVSASNPVGDPVDAETYPMLAHLQECMKLFPEVRYVDNRDGRAKVSEFRSELITMFIGALEIIDGELKFASELVVMFIEFLKQLTWHFVIDDPRLAAIRIGQRHVIEVCFTSLFSSASAVFIKEGVLATPNEHDKRSLDPRLLDYIQAGTANRGTAMASEIVARAVADYICSLTDQQTYELAGQLTGSASNAVPSGFVR